MGSKFNRLKFVFPAAAVAVAIFIILMTIVRNPSNVPNSISNNDTIKTRENKKDTSHQVKQASPGLSNEKQTGKDPSSKQETQKQTIEPGVKKAFDKLIAELKMKLNSKEKTDISETVSELAMLGEDAIPYIKELLNDPSTSMKLRAELFKTLGKIGGNQSVETLLEELSKDSHPVIRAMCSRAINQASGGNMEEILKKELLKKDNYKALTSLLKATDEVKDPDTLAELNRLMHDSEAPLEARISAAKFTGQEGLDFLEEKFNDSSLADAQPEIVESLRSLNTPEALDTLMRLSQGNLSEESRQNVYDAIGYLIETLSSDNSLTQEKLASIGYELTENLLTAEGEDVESISRILSTINLDSVRNTLSEEIQRRSDPSQIISLANSLIYNYSNADMTIPSEQSKYLLDVAMEYASSGYDENIRINALYLLRSIGGDQSTEFLRTLLNDGNDRIRSLVEKMIEI